MEENKSIKLHDFGLALLWALASVSALVAAVIVVLGQFK